MANITTTELQRRLIEDGFEKNEMKYGTVYRHGIDELVVNGNGDIFLETAVIDGKLDILRKNVTAYMSAFLNAERISNEDKHDARILFSYDDLDLIGIRSFDGTMEFEIRPKDNDIPFKYRYKSFDAAKLDFICQTRLIDHNYLFSVSHMEIMRTALVALRVDNKGKNVPIEATEEINIILAQINSNLTKPAAVVELMLRNN